MIIEESLKSSLVNGARLKSILGMRSLMILGFLAGLSGCQEEVCEGGVENESPGERVVTTPFPESFELISPDRRYGLELFEAPPHESNVRIWDLQVRKKLLGTFSYGYAPQWFLETAWSEDSKHLAVVSRGTKTTADVTVYRFQGGIVELVELSDYRLNILGWEKEIRGGRVHWVNQLRWDKSRLNFHCKGQWIDDGPGDPAINPENWYHVDVVMDFSSHAPRLISVEEGEKSAPVFK